MDAYPEAVLLTPPPTVVLVLDATFESPPAMVDAHPDAILVLPPPMVDILPVPLFCAPPPIVVNRPAAYNVVGAAVKYPELFLAC